MSKILLILLVLLTTNVEAKRLQHEAEYAKQTCNGILEYKNVDGTRTDCLMRGYAAEYDFADKWGECVGQALHYGRLNNKAPLCILIIEGKKDCKYIKRAAGIGTQVVILDYNKLCDWEGL